MPFTHRIATQEDIPALTAIMNVSIGELQKGFLTAAQITSSRTVMGIDTQLIEDGTYFVVEEDHQIAGCGGWSRRATLYGGDHTQAASRSSWTRRRTRPGCGRCTPTRPSPDGAWAG